MISILYKLCIYSSKCRRIYLSKDLNIKKYQTRQKTDKIQFFFRLFHNNKKNVKI